LTNGSSNWRFSLSTVANETIDVAKKKGWQAGLAKLDKERADWVHGGGRFPVSLLASPKGFALDAGCGWGGLTFWLAREFTHVYALDSQLDGLQFIDIRASQEKIDNITTTQGSLLSLPFPDGFFDVVVLNGVLEWVGTFSKEQPPLILQQRALKEIARVLQPNGTLFIAIENRLGLQYFLGYKEEHTGLRFISLLPRRFAQVLHRHFKGQDFRALTHSRPGLEKMLKACGFSKTEWFSIYPSYRNCRYATSLVGHGGLKFILRNFLSDGSSVQHALLKLVSPILLRSNFLLKMASFFSPSWGVFASRNAAPQLCLQEKKTPIVIKNSDDIDLVITVNDRRANIFQLARVSKDLQGKYTIPLNKQALKKIELAYSCVELIRKLHPELSNNLPEISIYSGNTHLFDYTKGMTGYRLSVEAENDLQLFFDFLLKFSNIQVPDPEIKGVLTEFDIRDRLAYLAYEDGLCKDIDRIIRRPQIIHGDLNKNNVLISRNDSAKIAVNDFEHAKIGPGILNWYDFLLRNLVIYGSTYPIKADIVLHRCTKLPGNNKSNPVLNKMTAMFLDRCHIQVAMHKQLIILYMRYLCQDPIVSDPDKVITGIKSGKYKL
jgi:ubiquinone/menaquinone biosynthesis C-methylase UbiE